MHYLEGHFDSALGQIVQHLVTTHKYISVHDLFNPELFHACLVATFADISELAPHIQSLNLPTLTKEGHNGQIGGYIELRLRNFFIVWNIMVEAFEHLNLPIGRQMGKQAIFRLVKQCDLDELQVFIEHLFELIIKNRQIVEFITSLPEEDQAIIKEFLQKLKNKQDTHIQQQKINLGHEDEKMKLEEENNELRGLLNCKQGELQVIQHQMQEINQHLSESRQLEALKQAQIESLKKRLMAYEETDSLFQQKDQQIARLQRIVSDLQLSSRLSTTSLSSEKGRLESRVAELEALNIEVQTKFDKLLNSFEQLSRQREDSQSSNKRVIANLRDRIKILTEKVNELQNQLVEAKIGRELREREFSQLMSNFQSLKSQASDPLPIIRETISDRNTLRTSSGGIGKQFLRLEEELNEIDKFRENAFEEEIMMFESGQDNLRRVQEIIAENNRLKQKINAQQGKADHNLRADNEKLKKRLAVMKKRNDQLQVQRRQQLQLMVSAFDGLIKR